MNYHFPRYISQDAILLYVIALIAVSMAFMRYAMLWYWWVFGIVEVGGFFYFSNYLTREWQRLSPQSFQGSLWRTGLTIRVIYVIFSYFFFLEMTGRPFDFQAADVFYYDDMARAGADAIWNGELNLWTVYQRETTGRLIFSDAGYIIYLGYIYALVGKSVFWARIIQCVWSTWTCWLVYKIAQRHFGESTARMAAIMCMLMPNMVMYCGLHLKETVMTFLTILFIERADKLIIEHKFIPGQTLLTVLIGLSTFGFRTVLGAVLFIAFFLALILSSQRVANWGRRIVIILLAALFVGILVGDMIKEEMREVVQIDALSQQQTSMDKRYGREGGNSLAHYAGAAVFAPMIFTLPFPTMVETPDQEEQRMLHGGNFCKNITSFFTVAALIMLAWPYNWRRKFFDGEWRQHVFPMAYFVGYLIVLVFSQFAQSERFHQPILPMSMMFAAVGISRFNPKWKRWYWLWLGVVFAIAIGWAWFKLKGRGWI